VFYGILPLAGAFFSRYRWRQFRRRFIDLGLKPLLDYRQYRQLKDEGGTFWFTGGIESITDDHTLWVKGEDLTISVSLDKTKCFLLPKREGEGIPDPLEQIRWNRVSTLTEGIKVYIGGRVMMQDNRLSFITTKENPLIVIFYSCSETELSCEIIRAARTRGDYLNSFTPASLVTGALALVYIAASLLSRPALRLNVITALIAVFIPVLPFIPPGLLFTVINRRITWYSRKLKASYDLTRLPPQNPDTPLHGYRYAIKAYLMELLGWIVLLLGIGINIIFIFLILSTIGF
jgi:hypothetical protein